MKQADLNRAVARATGESVREIERLGFSVVGDRSLTSRKNRPRYWSKRRPKKLIPQTA
jgi:hypothetical protein